MVARIARAFGTTMREVRRMTYRDIEAMSRVIVEERQAMERARKLGQRRR